MICLIYKLELLLIPVLFTLPFNNSSVEDFQQLSQQLKQISQIFHHSEIVIYFSSPQRISKSSPTHLGLNPSRNELSFQAILPALPLSLSLLIHNKSCELPQIIIIHLGYNFSKSDSKVIDMLLKFVEKLYEGEPECTWNIKLFILSQNVMSKSQLKQLSLRTPLNRDAFLIEGILTSKELPILGFYSYKNVTFSYQSKQLPEESMEKFMYTNLMHKLNLRGIPVIGAAPVVANKYYYTEVRKNSTHIEFTGGLIVDMFRYMKTALNFTESANICPDGIKAQKNGRLSGLATFINNESFDVSLSPNILLLERVSGPDRVGFLHISINSWVIAVFDQPSIMSLKELITQSLGLESWSVYFVVIVLTGCSIKIIQLHEAYDPLGGNVLLALISIICQQSVYESQRREARSFRIEVVKFFTFLTSMGINIFFTTSLLSVLSSGNSTVKKFQDMVTYGFDIYYDDPIIVTAGSIDANLKLKRRSMDAESIRSLMDSYSSIIAWRGSFSEAIQNDSKLQLFACNVLSSINVGHSPMKMAMVVKRTSPIRGLLNIITVKMHERGVRHRLFLVHRVHLDIACLPKPKNYKEASITVMAVVTPFIILEGGILLSVALLLIEKNLRVSCERVQMFFK